MKSAVLYQSFFSETGFENSHEIPHEIGRFFHEFFPENPAKFDFFFCDLPEALETGNSVVFGFVLSSEVKN